MPLTLMPANLHVEHPRNNVGIATMIEMKIPTQQKQAVFFCVKLYFFITTLPRIIPVAVIGIIKDPEKHKMNINTQINIISHQRFVFVGWFLINISKLMTVIRLAIDTIRYVLELVYYMF